MIKKFPALLLASLCGLMLVSATASCGGRVTKVSQEEVEQRIKSEIPIGSNKGQVIAFLDNLEINGIKAQHHGYKPDEPKSMVASMRGQYLMNGYITAVMYKTGYDHSQFQVYRINMVFYFDSDDRLKNYKLQTFGDW